MKLSLTSLVASHTPQQIDWRVLEKARQNAALALLDVTEKVEQ
jgi:hypothetical protein